MTYYDILEVSKDAGTDAIENAFRALAQKYQPELQSPDKKAWAEEKFKELQKAYEVLKDSSKRKAYDEFLQSHFTAQETATPVPQTPPVPEDIAQRKPVGKEISQHPRWKRVLAGILDLFGFAFLCTVLMTVAAPYSPFLDKFSTTGAAFGVYWLIWAVLECYFLSLFGTTVGKRLFGIVLTDANGQKIGFLQHIKNRYILLILLTILTFLSYSGNDFSPTGNEQTLSDNYENTASEANTSSSTTEPEKNSNKTSQYVDLGNKCMDKGEYAKAADYYTKAIRVNGASLMLYFKIGACYREIEAYDSAIESYQKGLELYQNNGDDAEIAEYCYGAIGEIYSIKDDFANSVIWYQKAIDLYKTKGGDTEFLGYCYYGQGQSYHNDNKFDTAISCYEKAIGAFKGDKIDPKNTGDCYAAMAKAYFTKKDYRSAIKFNTKALAKGTIDFEKAEIFVSLADSYSSIHERAKAIEFYKKAAREGDKSSQELLEVYGENW